MTGIYDLWRLMEYNDQVRIVLASILSDIQLIQYLRVEETCNLEKRL